MAHDKFVANRSNSLWFQNYRTDLTHFLLHKNMYSSRGVTSRQNSSSRMERVYAGYRCKLIPFELMCQLTIVPPHFNLRKNKKGNVIKWLQTYDNTEFFHAFITKYQKKIFNDNKIDCCQLNHAILNFPHQSMLGCVVFRHQALFNLTAPSPALSDSCKGNPHKALPFSLAHFSSTMPMKQENIHICALFITCPQTGRG